MFDNIHNPIDGKFYRINSKIGKNILKKYIANFTGGSDSETESAKKNLNLELYYEKLVADKEREEKEKLKRIEKLKEKNGTAFGYDNERLPCITPCESKGCLGEKCTELVTNCVGKECAEAMGMINNVCDAENEYGYTLENRKCTKPIKED